MSPHLSGDPVQGWQGLGVRAGQEALRLEADGLWWPDQARVPQEGAAAGSAAAGGAAQQLATVGDLTPPPLRLRRQQAKTTKKITIRLECKDCKAKKQLVLKRCKHFELGEKKKLSGGPSY